MTTSDAEHQRHDYLERLDVAMRSVPHGVATEIRAGIVEELEGLDATATAARIQQLGDPVLIAQEAGAESASKPTGPAVVVTEKTPLAQNRGFAIAAALTLAFGGYLVPIVGWFVGLVLVLISGLWRTWEKVVAIAAPLVAIGILSLVLLPMNAVGSVEATETDGGGFVAPGAEVNNPLVPGAGLGLWHALILIAVLVIPASGLWLLWRLRRR